MTRAQLSSRLAALTGVTAVLVSCNGGNGLSNAQVTTSILDASPDAEADRADGADFDTPADLESPDLDEDASPDLGSGLSEELCAGMCRVGLEVACPGSATPTMDGCVSDCLGQPSACAPQAEATYRCVVDNGSASLFCDNAQGLLALRTDYCVQEQSDWIDCLQKQ